ncbi:hypothetical protein PAPYR_7481 [Paratrimastix pyriformis]|uniref:Uncharacterized protein n=1 Tax=Paratrimastix pyriformis TaxID=342808 RepID=A0ABQ8UD55_9EUKA|nr:hypothetical protein PAPYR_7481 [Paratrimastix pyriformis]
MADGWRVAAARLVGGCGCPQVGRNATLWAKHVAWRNEPNTVQEYFYRIARFQYMHSQCRNCLFAATGRDPLAQGEGWDEPLDIPTTPAGRRALEDEVAALGPASARWNKVHDRFPLR